MSVEWLEHTGDIGMRIRSPRLEDLFTEGAAAMFRQIADTTLVEPSEETVIELEMESPDTTLREWLGELLYKFSAEGKIYCEFEVHLESNRFRGVARGESYDAVKHPLKTELKAVTWHQLRVERENNEWTGQVIFDV